MDIFHTEEEKLQKPNLSIENRYYQAAIKSTSFLKCFLLKLRK
jgi:hypothetical protein